MLANRIEGLNIYNIFFLTHSDLLNIWFSHLFMIKL